MLAAAPQHPQAGLVLGSALRRQGDAERARAVIEPLTSAHAGAWAVQLEWALVLFALGRTREVEAPLARALQLNPGSSGGLAAAGRPEAVHGRSEDSATGL